MVLISAKLPKACTSPGPSASSVVRLNAPPDVQVADFSSKKTEEQAGEA